MKKLIGLLLATGLTLGSFAQSKVIRGNIETRPNYNRGGNKTTTVVVVPRTGYYRPYGYGYGYGYRGYISPYGYMPYGYGYGMMPQADYQYRPTGLDLAVEQIRSDFSHEISSVRHDKSLAKSERKQKIRDLKHEREDAIISAKQKYYKESGRY